jgi:polar amino acid transport system ATP-binding protein
VLHVLKGIDLDALSGEVLDTMRLLAEEGMTMICMRHKVDFARDMSDRVALFH